MMDSASNQPTGPLSNSNHKQTPRMRVSAKRDFPLFCARKETNSFSNTESTDVPSKRKFPEKDEVSSNTMSNVESSTSRDKVLELVKSYRENLNKLRNEAKLNGQRVNIQLHQLAATCLGKSNWVNTTKRIGAPPGVEAGDKFRCRTELYITGVHLQYQRGIDYINKNGTLLATSIVATDHHSNELKSDVLIYTGEGGMPQKRPEFKDQVLEHGNLALKNSKERQDPVRVIVTESLKRCKNSMSSEYLAPVYIYDGLYIVEKAWQIRAETGKLVYKFQMRRTSGPAETWTSGQVDLTRGLIKARSCKSKKVVRIINDISDGKEKKKIPVVNAVDNERPSGFTYVASITDWVDNSVSNGCECTERCSGSLGCACKAKNGLEIPYDNFKRLVLKKPCIYECSPFCSCYDSCTNRVSQLGIQLDLEVFKTDWKGWGVRSRSYIRAGSFICEYVGAIIQTRETEQRVHKDEYLFDIGYDYDCRVVGDSNQIDLSKNNSGFTIDAKEFSNVGRFINHSCSPNLYVQNVLYDHYNITKPHVMFFAKKDIPPSTELTYDYNCRLGEVRYLNNSVKAKNCTCKSADCIGKFY